VEEESDGWPVPDDPTLRDAARALEAHGFAGELWDRDWRLAYLTTEYRLLVSAGRYHADVPGRGEFFLSPAMCAARDAWPTGPTFESLRDSEPSAVTMRFGLHWGSTLYVGRLLTSGRAEVTALGDEVNEAARIEACAVGGRALASKALIERIDNRDAEALGLDPAGLSYTPLAELSTAGEKARRDAPAIAVCEL
jgi:hypothetical protein